MASPSLSSRAVSGMAALRDEQSRVNNASNLTPPMLCPPYLSYTAARGVSPPGANSIMSRSACTSPVLRHRRPTSSALHSQLDEPSSATVSVSRGSSPTLETDAGQQHVTDMEASMHFEGMSESPELSSSPPPGVGGSAQFSHASHIGQLLSDYAAHRVIICMLLVLFMWHVSHPVDVDQRPRFGLERIQHHLVGADLAHAVPAKMVQEEGVIETKFSPLLWTFIDQYQRTWAPNLLWFKIGSHVLVNHTSAIHSLRREELLHVQTKDCESYINIRPHSQMSARFDLLTMGWLILMLPILLCVVYKDVHAVVTPIERMVSFVTQLARDPLSQFGLTRQTSLKSDMDPTMIVDVTREMSMIAGVDDGTLTSMARTRSLGLNEREAPTMASSFVEVTLQKLALLLQVGFGSAGGEIIAQNIIGDYLDPMIPGSKVFAVFGFCDISEFNKCTETLEESIMMFVNQIAAIVHDSCQHFGGSVNKNIGSAFLLVWKFDQADMKALKAAMQTTHKHRLSSSNSSNLNTPARFPQAANPKELEAIPPFLLARSSSRLSQQSSVTSTPGNATGDGVGRA